MGRWTKLKTKISKTLIKVVAFAMTIIYFSAHVECEVKSDDQVIESKKPKLEDTSETFNVEK